MMNMVESSWRLAFQVSPIILVSGIAQKVPGGMIPIAVFTEGLSLANGVLVTGSTGFTTSFTVQAGTSLIAQDIAEYPFYDMGTAANAVVRLPNRISMQMMRPANTQNAPYPEKQATFTALKAALDYHNMNGGSYNILTPAFVYTGCLMRAMVDLSGFSDTNKQVQHTWQFDFEQPLLLQSDLEQTMNNMMQKFNDGMPAPATWSGAFNDAKNWIGGMLP